MTKRWGGGTAPLRVAAKQMHGISALIRISDFQEVGFRDARRNQ
jgi:hypothetical protein